MSLVDQLREIAGRLVMQDQVDVLAAADRIEELEKENRGRCAMTDYTPEMVGALGDTDAQRLTEMVAINIGLRQHIEELEADMDQITGFLAAVGTVDTEESALAKINLLPSVEKAWRRLLSPEDGAS